MKTNSSPSRYRYCISRLSTLATSTLTPALNVRSTTLPDITFFSLVRTNAPPLPGLTCWNSTTLQSWPSMFKVMPFLRSFVVATVVASPADGRVPLRPGPVGLWTRLKDEQFPGNGGERLSRSRRPGTRADNERVLDSDTARTRQVNSGFDGDRDPVRQCTGLVLPEPRRLMDHKSNAMPKTMGEISPVAGALDDVTRHRVDVCDVGSDHGHGDPGLLSQGD